MFRFPTISRWTGRCNRWTRSSTGCCWGFLCRGRRRITGCWVSGTGAGLKIWSCIGTWFSWSKTRWTSASRLLSRTMKYTQASSRRNSSKRRSSSLRQSSTPSMLSTTTQSPRIFTLTARLFWTPWARTIRQNQRKCRTLWHSSGTISSRTWPNTTYIKVTFMST